MASDASSKKEAEEKSRHLAQLRANYDVAIKLQKEHVQTTTITNVWNATRNLEKDISTPTTALHIRDCNGCTFTIPSRTLKIFVSFILLDFLRLFSSPCRMIYSILPGCFALSDRWLHTVCLLSERTDYLANAGNLELY